MPSYRPTVGGGLAPQAPTAPRLNPNAYGGFGEATQGLGDVARQEIDRRQQQRQATQLAEARARANSQVNEFVTSLERDTDFRTYGRRWNEQWTQLEQSLQASVDPEVWDVLSTDLIGLRSDGTQRVLSMGYQREDDHNLSVLNGSIASILDSAVQPGVNHQRNLDLIGESLIEARDSGLISAVDAEESMRTYREDYRARQETAAIDRNPVGWLDAHTVQPVGDAPRGVRVNNPLNIAQGADFAGEVTSPDDFLAAFETPEQGIAAAVSNLRSYVNRHGINTIGEAIARWAPRGHGDNDPDAYANRVASLSGLDPDTPLNPDDFDQMRLLIPAMVIVEQGMQPYGEDVYRGGFQIAGLTGEGNFAVPTVEMEFSRPVIDGVAFEEQDRLYARAERAAQDQLAIAQGRVETRVSEEVAALGIGTEVAQPVSPDEIRGAYRNNPERGQELIRGLEQARLVSREMEAFHGMTNAEIASFVQEQEAALQSGGTVGIEDRIARVGVLSDAAQNIFAMREDPAAYAMSRSDQLRSMFENAETPQDWREAIHLSRESQLRFLERDDQVRPIPAAFVTSILDSYRRETDPVQRLGMLQTIVGDDVQVMDQLVAGGIDPGARVIMDAVDRGALGQNRAADLLGLLEDSEARRERFEQRYPESTDRNEAVAAAESVYDTMRGEVWDGRDAYVGSDPQTLELLAAERDTLARLAISLSLDEPNQPDPEVAARRLMPELFGGEIAISDDVGFAFVPSGQADALESGMVAIRQNLPRLISPTDFQAFLEGAGVDLTAMQTVDAWEALASDAMWVEVPGGYGLAMPIAGSRGRLLIDATGDVRVWTAADLMAASATVEASEQRQADIQEQTQSEGMVAP